MARRPPASSEYHAELLVEFCVQGIPLSAQSKNHARLRDWQDRVAERARVAAAGAALVGDAIEIRLSEFSVTRSIDRDNFAKPIQDAMQGIVFLNDRQVLRLESDWCDINGKYKVRFMSRAVAEALVAGEEFVWVRIYRHRPREVLIP